MHASTIHVHTQANTFEAGGGGGAPAAGLAGLAGLAELADGVRVAEMLHDMYVYFHLVECTGGRPAL